MVHYTCGLSRYKILVGFQMALAWHLRAIRVFIFYAFVPMAGLGSFGKQRTTKTSSDSVLFFWRS